MTDILVTKYISPDHKRLLSKVQQRPNVTRLTTESKIQQQTFTY